MNEFKCDKCGICCMHLNLTEIYNELRSNDDSCKFFDKDTRLCKIYDSRPEICRADVMYNYFKDLYTFEEYLELNYKACDILKERYK